MASTLIVNVAPGVTFGGTSTSTPTIPSPWWGTGGLVEHDAPNPFCPSQPRTTPPPPITAPPTPAPLSILILRPHLARERSETCCAHHPHEWSTRPPAAS